MVGNVNLVYEALVGGESDGRAVGGRQGLELDGMRGVKKAV